MTPKELKDILTKMIRADWPLLLALLVFPLVVGALLYLNDRIDNTNKADTICAYAQGKGYDMGEYCK